MAMANVPIDSLPIPPAALQEGGTEVLRAILVQGRLEIALRRAFEEPEVWGLVIADIARHAARIFATETAISEGEALEKIREIFTAELEVPTDLGLTSAIN